MTSLLLVFPPLIANTLLLLFFHLNPSMGAVIKVDIKQAAVDARKIEQMVVERREFLLKKAAPINHMTAEEREKSIGNEIPQRLIIAEELIIAADDLIDTEKRKRRHSGNIPIHFFDLAAWWLLPQGTIQLGTPPQPFTVAFAVQSPDTFVASINAKAWPFQQMAYFNASKSRSYKKAGNSWKDSLNHTSSTFNNGTVAKDLIQIGSMRTFLKFGLAESLLADNSMDWLFSGVEGIFGMSLANPATDNLASTLKQLVPKLDEPAFSTLTILNSTGESAPTHHFQIGSTLIEGHCSPQDYTYVPSTSADGYHTRLIAVKLVYPNGKVKRWALNMDMEFATLVSNVWQKKDVLEIHGCADSTYQYIFL